MPSLGLHFLNNPIFAHYFFEMANFHALRVKEVRRETPDTVSVSIDVPEHMKALFSYKQGQYLTFKKQLNGEEVRRSYSLCSSPVVDDDWRVAIKKVRGWKVLDLGQ